MSGAGALEELMPGEADLEHVSATQELESRPDLHLVPDGVALALRYAAQAPEHDDNEGGIRIDPGQLSREGVIEAFKVLVQRRGPEEAKPPGERDINVTTELLRQSDRLHELIPGAVRTDTVIEAYGL